eukprot:s369_g43.t1
MHEYNYISPWTAQTRALLLESSLAFPILASAFDEIFFEIFTQDSRHPVPLCDLHELGLHRLLAVQPRFFGEVRECREVGHGMKYLNEDNTAFVCSAPDASEPEHPIQYDDIFAPLHLTFRQLETFVHGGPGDILSCPQQVPAGHGSESSRPSGDLGVPSQ